MPVHLMRALTFLALGGLMACTGGEEDPVPPTPSLELGTGEQAFETIAEGDSIYVVQGPQGGYHLNGSLLAAGINAGNQDDLGDPSNPTITFRVFESGAQIDIGIEYTQGLRDGGEPFHYQLLGRRVILDATDAELDGVELEFEVEVADVDGVVLSDRRTVLAEPHPLNNSVY